MTNALIKIEDVDAIERIGSSMAASGYFSDAKEAAKAVVKICAGAEMGFGPFAAMSGIHIIKGKPTIGANLMAAAVKGHPKYDYRVVQMTVEICEIAYLEGGQEIGRSLFTKQDAQAAGTQNMDKYPRNMLFARAMSNGVKWFCPDVFQTGVYTPEELGAQVDADGEILDLTPTVTRPAETTTETTAKNGAISNGTHWIDGKTRNGKKVSAMFWAWAKSEMGLQEEEVHLALEVESVHDYTGSMSDAKTAINEWIARQADAQVSVEVNAESADG